MKGLLELKIEAEEAANFRGHLINWSKPHHGERNSVLTGECIKCGEWVQINTDPLPDDIDVGGPAVAVECMRIIKVN